MTDRVETLLAELIERLEREPAYDPEAFFRRHPEDESALRERFSKLRERGLLAERSLEGELIGGRYRVDGEIGSGGMGRVVRAFDAELGRSVAIKLVKVPPGRRAAAAELGERLRKEARVTGQLEHPSIVPVYDLGTYGEGSYYFVMRELPGRSLASLLADEPQELDARRSLDVVLRVGEALAYAHSRGVVHGDLKPGNVMIGSFGEVQVMDWGLSSALGEVTGEPSEARSSERPIAMRRTTTNEVYGTPSYMSPEQAQGLHEALDQRTDVFGVGALLYHLLSGNPPYWGGDLEAVLARARDGRLNDPLFRAARTRVAPELRALCRKAMAREPAQRYQNIEALAGDLRAFLEDRAVSAERDRPARRVAKLVRRHPTAASVLTLMTGVAIVGSLVFARHAEVRARNTLLERDERTRVFARALERLDEAETRNSSTLGTPGDGIGVQEMVRDRAEQLRTFSEVARSLLRVLAEWEVDLTGATSAQQAAARVQGEASPEVRELLLLGIYRVAKCLDISGISTASVFERHGAPGGDTEAWEVMAERYRDLADVWPRLRALVAQLDDQDAGEVGLAALEGFYLGDSEPMKDVIALAASASVPELDFLTYLIEQRQGTQAAVPFIDAALCRNRSSFWLHARRARAGLLASSRDENQAELQRAVAHGEAAVALRPATLSGRLWLAVAYDRSERLDDALALYRELVQSHPESAVAWFNLGALCRQEGNLEEALWALEEAARLDPLDPWAEYDRGAVLHAQGDHAEAVEAFDRGRALMPSRPEYECLRARSLLELERYAEAVDAALAALSSAPEDHPGVLGLIDALYPVVPDDADRARIEAAMKGR